MRTPSDISEICILPSTYTNINTYSPTGNHISLHYISPDPTNGPGFDNDGNEIDGEEDGNGLGGDGPGGDGSGGDRGTNRGNVEAGEQRGADEDAVLSERINKEMTDEGGASGSGVRTAD
ncbi:unnamed protein product [Ectocarpus sp. CCAP 1310/34]|nr:unnamed protein product [Ectocarpus sp. CCAP 1310/34]